MIALRRSFPPAFRVAEFGPRDSGRQLWKIWFASSEFKLSKWMMPLAVFKAKKSFPKRRFWQRLSLFSRWLWIFYSHWRSEFCSHLLEFFTDLHATFSTVPMNSWVFWEEGYVVSIFSPTGSMPPFNTSIERDLSFFAFLADFFCKNILTRLQSTTCQILVAVRQFLIVCERNLKIEQTFAYLALFIILEFVFFDP